MVEVNDGRRIPQSVVTLARVAELRGMRGFYAVPLADDDGRVGTLSLESSDPTVAMIAGLVTPDGGTVKFDIDPFRKHCLLNGLDDIGLTMEKAPAIDAFEARQHEAVGAHLAVGPRDRVEQVLGMACSGGQVLAVAHAPAVAEPARHQHRALDPPAQRHAEPLVVADGLTTSVACPPSTSAK